jgi:hypothetical protein
MSGHVTEQDVIHALEVMELTLPVTSEELKRARRVQLYNWNPARYANLTNNPKQYMQAYKKAEDMTRRIEAAYMLLTAVLVPDDSPNDQHPPKTTASEPSNSPG